MREALLARIGALGVEHPYAVLAAALALSLGSLALLPTLELSSSRFDLIAGAESFVEVPGARTDLVALVISEDPRAGRAAADALAGRLARERGVQTVLHRIDPSLHQGRELFYLPGDQLEAAIAASSLDGLAPIVAMAREGFGGGAETLDALEADAPAPLDAGPGLLAELLEEAERWQRDPDRDALALGPAQAAPVDAQGYLASVDGRTRYVVVAPTVASDRYEAVAPLVARARAIGAEVAAAHGVEVLFTGYPALAVDETDTIREGSFVTGIVSSLLVMALFAAGFRSRGAVVLAGLPLGLGMLWAFGGVALTVGHLTLLTQAAAPTYAGIGNDFSVHLLAAYDAERRAGTAHALAVERAMRGTGIPIVTGALTTVGAFFALCLTEHVAFRELGLVAGGGLLVVLASILFVTPALLTIGERRGVALLRVGHVASPAGMGPARGRFVALVTERPWAVLAVTAAAGVALAVGAARVRFEANVEALLPADAESVVAAERLRAEGSFSSEVLVVRAPDLDGLRDYEARLRGLGSVHHVESVASFVPPDPQRTLQIARSAEAPVPRDAAPAPLGPALLGLARDAEAAAREVGALAGEGAGPALELRRLAAAARALADGIDAERAGAFDAALAGYLRRIGAAAAAARAGTLAPPTLDDLPPSIRRRLVDDADGYPLYVHPRGDLFAPGALAAFVRDVRAVAPDAAGSPADFEAFLAAMARSLRVAVLVALLVITLFLAADLRHPRDVVLALVPLAVGMVALFGLLGWLGIPTNMASLAGVPLILGCGVDAGVHLIHRRRADGHTARALGAVLRALVLTAVTTVAGFGSLALAAHRGMQTFALVMGVGVTACLFGSTVVLPALIRVVWPDRAE